MHVENIMSCPVTITHPKVKVGYLKDQFARKNIHAAPVLLEDGTIAGIVSSTDLVKCHDENLFVEDIMSDHVHIALRTNRVQDAAAVMVKHGVHHLVVMEDGQVIGMVSSMDIMKSIIQ